MKVVLINKEVFQNRPPVISMIMSLSDLGYNVSLVCVGINHYWRRELEKRGIECFVIPDRKKRNKVNKLFEYYSFKRKTLDYISSKFKQNQDLLVWTIGGNTIFCLGSSIKQYRYILQIQELHENDNRYKRVFSKVINDAEQVFVNEYNRSVLFQCWYNLKKRPVVIPNKPYFIDTESKYDLSLYVDANDYMRIKNSKVVLFQGQIVSYRDLSPYIMAAKELGGYQIVLMGNEYGMVKEYKKIDDSLIYIERIPAPDYLGITALAHICLITYDTHSLNNCYCAPNKIYEYGAFGKPMIGNDIPGLRVISNFYAGVLVDENDISSVKDAYITIENDYSSFSEGANKLYDSVDTNAIISSALKSII